MATQQEAAPLPGVNTSDFTPQPTLTSRLMPVYPGHACLPAIVFLHMLSYDGNSSLYLSNCPMANYPFLMSYAT